jgi:hypothetical protein
MDDFHVKIGSKEQPRREYQNRGYYGGNIRCYFTLLSYSFGQ